MFGSNRNSGIRSMQNYTAALSWYHNTPPIRGNGRNAGIRPLGHRDRPQFHISLDEATQAIYCTCYQTPVITYYPNGTIRVAAGGYNSQTTAAFVSDVLGVPTAIRDNSLVISLRDGLYRAGAGILLNAGPLGLVVETGATHDLVHRIDRKAMKEARNKSKGFINYARGMIKVSEGRFDVTEIMDLSEQLKLMFNSLQWQLDINFRWRDSADDIKRKHVELMRLTESSNIGNWYRALLWLVGSSAPRYRTDVLYANESDVMRLLNEAHIVMYPHVLVATEVPLGTISIDRYKKFAPFKEIK